MRCNFRYQILYNDFRSDKNDLIRITYQNAHFNSPKGIINWRMSDIYQLVNSHSLTWHCSTTESISVTGEYYDSLIHLLFQ